MMRAEDYGEFGTIYLLHFNEAIGPDGNPRNQAMHYTGWARSLDARLYYHARGKGARLTQVAVERGIGWTLARTWCGTRSKERELKNQGGASRRCPICKGHEPVLVAS